ncbi:MAG: hypothetical protein K2G30_07015, partial [Muribaculaceae bacterium]|nr:hypothetical protein [Muribaculaceae bacterium]
MKQTLLLTAMAVALSASAAVPFEKGKTAPRQKARVAMQVPSRSIETKLLIDEDFSRFTEGTETAPAAGIIDMDGYHIPEKYTAQPGWTGGGVHSAGGAVALYEYQYVNDYYPDEVITRAGYISTPPFMLNGTATLTFRAKALTDEGASLWLSLCDDYYGPGDDEMDIELGPEWKSYTLVATEGSLEEPSYFQFYCEEGVTLIDDVRLEFRNDRIATPYALPALNRSATEFVAMWEEVPGAT